MQEARGAKSGSAAQGRIFRNGLGIALLAVCSIRVGSFASLTLGHSFLRIDDPQSETGYFFNSLLGRNASSWRSIGRKAACRRPSGSVRGIAATNSPCPRTSTRECSTARASIASVYFTLSIGGREGRKSFSGLNLNGRGLVGCSGLLGQRNISRAMCVFLYGRLFTRSFRPSKLCGSRTGSPSTYRGAAGNRYHPHCARRCER